jgi:hypothetical protein
LGLFAHPHGAFDYVNNNGTYTKKMYLHGNGQEKGTVASGSLMVNALDSKGMLFIH